MGLAISGSLKWVMIIMMLLLLVTTGTTNPIPVMTINSPDGDYIDCIRILDQIAFQHPQLVNHIIQEFPTGMSKTGNGFETRQVWHQTGQKCPDGTISIRRDRFENTTGSRGNFYPNAAADRATLGHKYAVGYKESKDQKFYGTKTTFNLSDPKVEASGDFSLAQIWVASGSYDTEDLNTMEAGWQVYPSRYLDHQPRFFTLWTTNAYGPGSCYGIHCPGFVQTSNTIALEAAFSRNDQFDITIQIWKDQVSSNWWVGLGRDILPVGYWPAVIFTGALSDHATAIHWGGEVLYRNISGVNAEAQMGSGQFAEKGFRKAAYFCNLSVAADNYNFLPVEDFGIQATDPKYYTVKKRRNKECGQHFYFGGPGPMRSTAAVRGLLSGFLVFFCLFSFLV